ncbi:MAG: DUF3108 domain-containing protein [Alphaproteobacteria bacterium]|nr:DUF3108 domain-containing protein [Alphaproteobacteria bacterium]
MVPLAPSRSAAEGDRIDLRIEMYAVAGLHVMTIHESLAENASGYAINVGLQSRGLADLFANIQSHTEAQGRIAQDRVYSETLTSETKRNGKQWRVRASYGPQGAISGELIPSDEPRTPVTPAQMRGTVDELTAYYQLERQLARTGSCVLTVAVFDGFRRYDLHFSDLEPEVLVADSEHHYAGPTRSCDVMRRKISGFPVDDHREGIDHGRMWFARLVPGAFMVPVKMEFDTELGLVTAYLAELHGRGINLALSD